MENHASDDNDLRLSSATTIWVGGSSALTQTYMEEIQDDSLQKDLVEGRRFVLAFRDVTSLSENKKATNCTHLPLDVTQKESIDTFFDALLSDKTRHFGPLGINDTIKITIIFGIRCSLVTGSEEEHMSLVKYLSYFLHQAAASFQSDRRLHLSGVLHVSSVAVMDHTQAQSMLNEDAPLPPQLRYASPYDAMKRKTEDILSSTCKELKIVNCTHLRISGIFSNEVPPTSCIQMSAVRIQAYLGSHLQTPLDMNTSYNACQAIRLVLDRMDDVQNGNQLEQVYFYTRPTIEPRAYGDNLVAYRSAHNIGYCISVPFWVASFFMWAAIYLFRGIASAGSALSGKRNCKWLEFICDLLNNLAYLLTVSMVEHTFDNSRIRRDFPELNLLEESVLEGFVRIRKRRLFAQNAQARKILE